MSANSLPSVSSEAEELRSANTILLETFTHCNELKSDILQYSSNPRKELEDFKEKLVDLSEMQKELSALIETMITVESAIQEEEDISELDSERISRNFKEVYLTALGEQYTNEEVEKIISAVDTYISNPNSEENVGSEDLTVTATKESYLDPLTKFPIKDPVKSKTCHHTFERDTIFRHIQRYPRCPYSGCSNTLSKDDLVEDLALKRQLLQQ